MTQSLANVRTTGRYSTTEVAGLLGVNRATVARWVQRGLIRCGYRRHNHRRFYEGTEIIRFFNSSALKG